MRPCLTLLIFVAGISVQPLITNAQERHGHARCSSDCRAIADSVCKSSADCWEDVYAQCEEDRRLDCLATDNEPSSPNKEPSKKNWQGLACNLARSVGAVYVTEKICQELPSRYRVHCIAAVVAAEGAIEYANLCEYE